MGLFTGLLTLPLAPVRGVVWIGECIEQEALRQLYDPEVIGAQLAEVEEAMADGVISREEGERLQEELVARLMNAAPPDLGGLEA